MIETLDLKHLKNFYSFAKRYKKNILFGLIMIPISIASNLLFPWLVIQIIDKHLMLGQRDGLYTLILWMLVILIINYFSDALYSYFLRKTGQTAIFDMREVLFKRILCFPRSYFDTVPTGVSLARLTSDLEAIGESFVLGIVGIVKDFINTVALLIFMFIIDWQLSLVILCVFPPILYLTQHVRKKLRTQYLVTHSELAKGTGFLQECLAGIKTVQLFSAELEVETQYRKNTLSHMHAQLKANKYDAALYSLITGITSITIALIIWFGADKILQLTLSLGVLIAFINTMEKIFIPLRDFTSQIADIQRSFAAFDHIEELFLEPLEEAEEPSIQSRDIENNLMEFKSLEFKDVSFKYREEDEYALKNISFSIQKGEQFALVGETGSGKSTIIRLINKSYTDYEGSILINGIEVSRIPKKSILHLFYLMQQDVFLFNEDIYFNISLGNKNLDYNDVVKAAKYVFAHNFIMELPDQYKFKLKNNGSNLSTGQTQLISFARAIALGGQVIMLDEATSSVDSLTEDSIQKAIDKLLCDKTVIAIAHRLSTIQNAKQILVMKEGQIIERGSHKDLLANQGVYARLLKENSIPANDKNYGKS
jgi:ATP-binding cassette, subfamily B, multidrug efflux pump